jgi:hypothetical protein
MAILVGSGFAHVIIGPIAVLIVQRDQLVCPRRAIAKELAFNVVIVHLA